MIVETSALVAIARGEPEAAAFAEILVDQGGAAMSAADYLEAAVVIDGAKDAVASAQVDTFVNELGIRIEPVIASQARIARQANRDFGMGSGHPARLNFGDGFPYVLATERGEPLLFNSDDFGHTGMAKAG